MVQLDSRNLFTKRSSRKLKNHHVRKYFVKKVISPYSIKLDLFLDFYIHLVFYINLLEPLATNPSHLGHVQTPGPPIEFDEKIKYEVSAIVDSCLFGRAKRLQYYIQWIGYVKLNWEYAKNITYVIDLLYNFSTNYSQKHRLLSQLYLILLEFAPKERVMLYVRL